MPEKLLSWYATYVAALALIVLTLWGLSAVLRPKREPPPIEVTPSEPIRLEPTLASLIDAKISALYDALATARNERARLRDNAASEGRKLFAAEQQVVNDLNGIITRMKAKIGLLKELSKAEPRAASLDVFQDATPDE